MCLALPAKLIEKNGELGVVELADNRYQVNLIMTPEAKIGDYLLIHAGYAIQIVDAQSAKETWDLIEENIS